MIKLRNKGFTIIELLVATVVFSVVLLVVTTAIIQFSRIYYKGVVQTRTQERARAIVEDIAQNLQFSGSSASLGGNQTLTPVAFICAGNRVYNYTKNAQASSSQHVLVAQNGVCPPSPFTSTQMSGPSILNLSTVDATELVGENMQLLDLSVTPAGPDLFTIKVRLAYGSSSDLTSTTPKVCKPIKIGGQFCAVSELTTTVYRRLQ